MNCDGHHVFLLQYLGTFTSEVEAARAYDRAALQYRGNKVGTS